MTARDFCYWLQGYIEITLGGPRPLEPVSEKQMQLIQKHLAMVFITEIDPSFSPDKQEPLNNAHTGQSMPKIGGKGPDGVTYRC
jgi:hypothetical protein